MNKILKVTLPILAVAIIGGIILSIPKEEELKPKIESQSQTTVIEKVQPIKVTSETKFVEVDPLVQSEPIVETSVVPIVTYPTYEELINNYTFDDNAHMSIIISQIKLIHPKMFTPENIESTFDTIYEQFKDEPSGAYHYIFVNKY